MSNDIRRKYYWGNCDWGKYKIRYADTEDAIRKIWKATTEEQIDDILKEAFEGLGDLYAVMRTILLSYVKHPEKEDQIDCYLEGFCSVIQKKHSGIIGIC